MESRPASVDVPPKCVRLPSVTANFPLFSRPFVQTFPREPSGGLGADLEREASVEAAAGGCNSAAGTIRGRF